MWHLKDSCNLDNLWVVDAGRRLIKRQKTSFRMHQLQITDELKSSSLIRVMWQSHSPRVHYLHPSFSSSSLPRASEVGSSDTPLLLSFFS